MSRTATGHEVLEQAKSLLKTARTVEELRQAQAVVLPLEFGMSLDDTAQVTGLSKGWVNRLRVQFIRDEGKPKPSHTRGGRMRENLSREEEAQFLQPFLEQAKGGGILVVQEIKLALEARLDRSVALASVYNLLHRHNWRKLAPDKRHPKSDPAAQAEWKKNCRPSSPPSAPTGRKKGRSA